MTPTGKKLMELYHALLNHLGPQHWWPAKTPTETIIGAILVQHAAWKNVERAIDSLRGQRLLDFRAIDRLDESALAGTIRSVGTAKVKARRLKAFAHWLDETYQFDPDFMTRTPLSTLRESLLSISGIGPETADCILLYACGKPTFVVDAYTHRVMVRHRLAAPDWGYDELKELFESNLPADVDLFNEYHALLVAVGKKHCRKSALCTDCPLEHFDHDSDTM